MGQTCPKCGYTRSGHEQAPAWQCPSCGIAYHKYEQYRQRAKSIAQSRQVTTVDEKLVDDGSVWSLVGVNVFVLILALALDWRLIDMMLIYWLQSVVIGGSYVARILALEKFSTENFKIGGKSVEPTASVKWQAAMFFVLHFGIFHFAYASFMLGGSFGDPRLGPDLLIAGAAFVFNHAYSYRYHRERDRQGVPRIGKLFSTPYLRILPMHLTVMLGMAGSGGAAVLLFGLLKTFADAAMHQAEHKIMASD